MSAWDFIKDAPLRLKFMAVCAVGAAGLVGTYEVQPERTNVVTVSDKARAWTERGNLYDRVNTDKGVFAVYRVDMRSGFQRNANFDNMNVGCTYRIRSYGIHAPLFLAPTIRRAEHVATPACPTA